MRKPGSSRCPENQGVCPAPVFCCCPGTTEVRPSAPGSSDPLLGRPTGAQPGALCLPLQMQGLGRHTHTRWWLRALLFSTLPAFGVSLFLRPPPSSPHYPCSPPLTSPAQASSDTPSCPDLDPPVCPLAGPGSGCSCHVCSGLPAPLTLTARQPRGLQLPDQHLSSLDLSGERQSPGGG